MPDDDVTTVEKISQMLDDVEKWVKEIRLELSSMRPGQRLTVEKDALSGRLWQPLTRGCQLPVIKIADPGPKSTAS